MAAAELPSDEAIKAKLAPIVKEGDLDELTMRKVMKRLQAEFGVKLKSRKAMVSAEVTRLINAMDDDDLAPEEPAHLAESKDGERAKAARKEARAKQAKTKLKRSAPKKKASLEAADEASAGGGSGIMKPVGISRDLADFLSLTWTPELKLPRTQVVKAVITYVKENELQNPEDRREILCDDGLRRLLKHDTCTFFSLNKYLSPHFAKSEKKKADPSEKKGPSGGSFNAEKTLSPALEAVVGPGPMSRPQVVKKLWVYIKEHELQDPADRRQILCDATLKAVFHTDRVHMMGMNRLLSLHIHKDPPAAGTPKTKTEPAD